MAADIRVMLHAQMRHYNGGSEETSLPFVVGATSGDYLERLAIPQHEYMGLIIDGILTNDRTLVLSPGSLLELVPAISGG